MVKNSRLNPIECLPSNNLVLPTQGDQKMAQRSGVTICSNWWAVRKAPENSDSSKEGRFASAVVIQHGSQEEPAPEESSKEPWAEIRRGWGWAFQSEPRKLGAPLSFTFSSQVSSWGNWEMPQRCWWVCSRHNSPTTARLKKKSRKLTQIDKNKTKNDLDLRSFKKKRSLKQQKRRCRIVSVPHLAGF